MHSFAVLVGGVVQNAWGKLKGTSGGIAVGFDYLYGRKHALVIEPRFLVVFGNDASQPEIGVNIGYRLQLGDEAGLSGGAQAALATNLWINTGNAISDPVFFYIGGQVAGFLKYKRFTAQIPIDVGVLPFFSPSAYAVTVAFLAGVSF